MSYSFIGFISMHSPPESHLMTSVNSCTSGFFDRCEEQGIVHDKSDQILLQWCWGSRPHGQCGLGPWLMEKEKFSLHHCNTEGSYQKGANLLVNTMKTQFGSQKSFPQLNSSLHNSTNVIFCTSFALHDTHALWCKSMVKKTFRYKSQNCPQKILQFFYKKL